VRVVLDSSVLVAGLRSKRGASFALLRVLRKGRFEAAISVPLVLEYEAVLLRHATELGLAEEEAIGLVDYLCAVGRQQEVRFLWRPSLSDPRDEFILELAVAARAEAIVTHNVRDFEGAEGFGVRVLTPGEFVRLLEDGL
jgi:putative PIN family toxin of toxin-antitoxin system